MTAHLRGPFVTAKDALLIHDKCRIVCSLCSSSRDCEFGAFGVTVVIVSSGDVEG